MILGGDAQQLPPIGSGALFKDMTSKMIPDACIINLIDIVRQDTGTLCEVISLMGDYKHIVKNPKFYDFYTYVPVLLPKLIDWDPDTMVLTPLNRTRHVLNIRLQERYNKTHPKIEYEYGIDYHDSRGRRYESYCFRVTDPIIQESPTDYERNTFRGERSNILSVTDDGQVMIQRQYDKKIFNMSVRNLYEQYLPAWCITIHKAQGAQNKKVILYLPSDASFNLSRSSIYTAISRAEETCQILTDITKEEFVTYYEKEIDILTGFSLSIC